MSSDTCFTCRLHLRCERGQGSEVKGSWEGGGGGGGGGTLPFSRVKYTLVVVLASTAGLERCC